MEPERKGLIPDQPIDALPLPKIDKEAERAYRENAKFIPIARMKAEGIEWPDLVDSNEHCPWTHFEIVDSTGTVYTGIEYDHGSIETAGYSYWDCIETFRADRGRPLWKMYVGGGDIEILYWNEDTCAFYLYEEGRNCENHTSRVTDADLLRWLPKLPAIDAIYFYGEDEGGEYDGHGHIESVFVSLPVALLKKARKLGRCDQSERDWIVEALSKAIETNEDGHVETSIESLTEQD